MDAMKRLRLFWIAWCCLWVDLLAGSVEREVLAAGQLSSLSSMIDPLQVMLRSLNPGDTVFHINSGAGSTFIPIVSHLGERGVGVAISMSNDDIDPLKEKLQEQGLWSRTLIVSASTVLDAFNNTSMFHKPLNIFIQLHDVLQRCPTMVIVQYDSQQEYAINTILMKAMWVVMTCKSTVYLSNVPNAALLSYSLDLLTALGYTAHLHIHPCHGAEGSTDGHCSSILLTHTSSSSSLIHKAFGEDLPYHPWLQHRPTLCRYGRSMSSESGCVEGIYVDLSVLLPGFSLTRCLVQLMDQQQQLTIWLPDTADRAAMEQIIFMRCSLWVGNIMSTLPDSALLVGGDCSYKADSTLAETGRLQLEGDRILQNCINFVNKRYTTLLDFSKLRSQRYEVAPIANRSAPGDPHQEYGNYNPTTFNGSDWLSRPVFGTKYEYDSCGEPIWCGYTLEMQKKIHNWQFPPLRTPDVPVVGNFKATMEPRSCENVKFLVFEVPSHQNGIGSMMLVISAMFRYAICLDRILVLSMHNQLGTLTKWGHPGCEGDVWGCYFLPITNCDIPYEILSKVPKYFNTDNFELSPLRDERVLVLIDFLPWMNSGKCSVCYDDWDITSRFWVGTYLPAYNNNIMPFTQQSVHFRVFMEKLKLTWVSQFLRFFMRPRPWLQHGVDQIVAHSLHSPLVAALSVSPPKRFISLHVRYGAKIVEVERKPLRRYMEFIKRKLPDIRDIFLSTETEVVIGELIR